MPVRVVGCCLDYLLACSTEFPGALCCRGSLTGSDIKFMRGLMLLRGAEGLSVGRPEITDLAPVRGWDELVLRVDASIATAVRFAFARDRGLFRDILSCAADVRFPWFAVVSS